MEIWDDLKALEGSALETLGDQPKEFLVESVGVGRLVVKPNSSAASRTIYRIEIQGVIDAMKSQGSINLAGMRNYAKMNVSYVASLLGALDYVEVTKRPITLRFKPT